MHGAARDDRDGPGLRCGDGHQRGGCEVGYDELAGQPRRARDDLVGLAGADLDDDALVGAEQGDALVVADQHRAGAAVVDVPLVLGRRSSRCWTDQRSSKSTPFWFTDQTLPVPSTTASLIPSGEAQISPIVSVLTGSMAAIVPRSRSTRKTSSPWCSTSVAAPGVTRR